MVVVVVVIVRARAHVPPLPACGGSRGGGGAGCLVDVLMASSDVSKHRRRGKCWRREGFHYTNMGILGLFFAAVIVSELNKSTQMV